MTPAALLCAALLAAPETLTVRGTATVQVSGDVLAARTRARDEAYLAALQDAAAKLGTSADAALLAKQWVFGVLALHAHELSKEPTPLSEDVTDVAVTATVEAQVKVARMRAQLTSLRSGAAQLSGIGVFVELPGARTLDKALTQALKQDGIVSSFGRGDAAFIIRGEGPEREGPYRLELVDADTVDVLATCSGEFTRQAEPTYAIVRQLLPAAVERLVKELRDGREVRVSVKGAVPEGFAKRLAKARGVRSVTAVPATDAWDVRFVGDSTLLEAALRAILPQAKIQAERVKRHSIAVGLE